MIDLFDFNRLNKSNQLDNVYKNAQFKKEILTNLKTPYKRPSISSRYCLSFLFGLLYEMDLKLVYKCQYEEGTII